MASRVNTKFVVILIVAVVAMLGMLFAAYSVVYKTADDLAKRGDEALAAGDIEQACLLYSKAVNKDSTIVENIEKWINALEQWTPDTETAYRAAFRTNYLGAIRQASVVQRTNVEAYQRELGLQLDMLLAGYSRGMADRIVLRTTEVLGNFDGLDGVDPSWPTLRRYRGIAWERISASNGVIDESQYELVREDLKAALAADPSDDQAMASLMRWMVYEEIQRSSADDYSGIQRARVESIAMGQAHLANHKQSPQVLIALIATEMDVARTGIPQDLIDSARTKAVLDSLLEFRDKIDMVYSETMSFSELPASVTLLQNFRLLEQLSDPESKLARSLKLGERMIELHPGSSTLMMVTARFYSDSRNTDQALQVYGNVVNMPTPPISTQGFALFNNRREALLSMSSLKLDEYDTRHSSTDKDEAYFKEVLAQAMATRDQYASQVPEDNTSLMLINGRISYANGNIEEALRLYKRYNTQTENRSSIGLWLEAVAASNLDQLGTARSALLNLLLVNQHNVRALLMLGEIEIVLQEYGSARRHFQKALVVNPGNDFALKALTRIDSFENPALIEDPVMSLVRTAQQYKRGTEENPGDPSKAIEFLIEGIESVNYAPQAIRELTSMLMDQGDVDRARSFLDKAVQANPDLEELATLRAAFDLEDEVDILVLLIQQTYTEEDEKFASIAGVAFSRGRFELLDETLEQFLEAYPNDPRAIDMTFVRSLGLDNVEKATEMSQRATILNTDSVNGLSYQARLASFQGDHSRAVQLLLQATSGGSADTSLYRLLALEQLQLGRTDSAIKSFEQALSIRPDDRATIVEYVNALSNAGKSDDALAIARRFQRYANSDLRFMSLWLSLEASAGGKAGQEFAIRQRESFLQLNPDDLANKFSLAKLYILTEKWTESRHLIDELRAGQDALHYAQLEALWYANQGRVGTTSGLASARDVFLDYIESSDKDKEGAAPHIALARFMLERGRPDLALQAASAAVSQEDPTTLDGTKLMGDLFMMLGQYTNATESFRKIVDSGADTDNKYKFRLVDMLIRTRLFDEAKTIFNSLQDSDKATRIGMLQIAEIEEGLENPAVAAELLNKAVSAFPEDPLVYIKRAEFLGTSPENLPDLLADIDAALALNPNDWRAYRIRAAGYFAAGDRADALKDLQRAVRLNPSLDQALFGIINEMMADGRYSEAQEFAIEIIEQREHDASLINSLGQIFSSRKEWDRALVFYKLLWEVQRSPTAGATLIDAITRTRNPDTTLANAVINDLTEIAGDIDKSPGLLAAQAIVLQARGRDQLAMQQLTKAFDLSADSDELLLHWSGNINRYFEDQPAQSHVNYLETLKLRNPNQEVLNWLNFFIARRVANVAGQTDAAFTIFDVLIQLDAQPAIQRVALQNYGNALYALKDYSKAIEIWSKGTELYPDDWEMNNNLAYVLSTHSGEHDRALALAQNAIKSNPNRSEPYDTLAKIYMELGQFEKSRKTFNEGMKYALSGRARVTIILGLIELDLAEGNVSESRSKLIDVRSLMRAMPTRDENLEEQVDEIEGKIDSAS